AECKLVSSSIIADIGSGTGILSRLFLKNDNIVFGVEPNKEMRKIAERLLKNYSNFKSVDGAAESTNLKGQSVDFITSGQAFHWFNTNKSRKEFLRILKPNGWAVHIWNDRKTDTTPFLKAYDSLLYKYGIDYKEVNQQIPNERAFTEFFGHISFKLNIFHNFQIFDFESLRGRVLSSSYVPIKGHPNYEPMINELRKIFLKYQSNGKVRFAYDTKVYYGQFK
ncbi:MAG: class I SAM-dependent methyltransferase, partial [Thermodesulfobacteriota bacterium]